MAVSWNNEYDPNQLAQKIEQSRVIDEKGGIGYTGFETFEYIALLFSMLNFSNGIPEIEGRRIVQQAVYSAGKRAHITAMNILAEINRLEGEFLRTPLIRYILVTSLSVSKMVLLPKININNAYITFGGQLSKVCQRERDRIIANRAQNILYTAAPTDYLTTRIYVSARSPYEAIDLALNAMNLIRGIWNWFYNRQHSIRMSLGSQTPVNKIVQGPVHTLHLPNGNLAIETFWYEPRFYSTQRVYNPTPEIDKLCKFTSNVRKRLAKCKYHQVIEDSIIQYARALDERDWEAAFLRLWSILERLTNTSDFYTDIIKRASFIFEDREYYKQVLKHLKDFRNKYVHEAGDSSEMETYMYELKNIVESLLGFHLGNKFNFNSISEVAEFLDLSSDRDALASRVKLINYAQKFLHYV
jgi:hypothetical protein